MTTRTAARHDANPAVLKLEAAVRRTGAGLCVGLDPDPARLPAGLTGLEGMARFCAAIVEATADLAAAFKPNLAFFEALGPDGWHVLRRVLVAIPADVPVILDAKRGDIGSTARMYADALYRELGADAATVSPYLGREAIQPFIDHADKLTFVLAATSNPGAGDVQEAVTAEGLPLYRHVARLGAALDGHPGAVGLVAGATVPDRLAAVRTDAPASWLLVPGVGAQGGDLAATLTAGLRPDGQGVLVNASRSILYASAGPDFAEAARSEATTLRDAIRDCASRLPRAHQEEPFAARR